MVLLLNSSVAKEYKGVKIFIDEDMNYEINNFLKRFVNLLLVPVLNHLPKKFQRFVKKTHKSAEEVIEYATTHKAIEILYKKGATHASRNRAQKFMQEFWFHTNNAKAVRNRLKLVEKVLRRTITSLTALQKRINILSIASGSARAVIETLSSLNISNKKISVKFLDKSTEAIAYSKELANKLPRRYETEWITDTASNFPRYYRHEKPDIIEMVGLMDYFHDPWVIRILASIRENLSDKGTLITANIMPNMEQGFVSNIVGWKMIYRTPEDLADLALAAGFDRDKVRIVCEPLKIHAVLIAKK